MDGSEAKCPAVADVVGWVEEGHALDVEIKALKKKFDARKDSLGQWYLDWGGRDQGKTVTAETAKVTFSETKLYNDIPIPARYEKLQALGKLGELFNVVKVNNTALKTVLGSADIAELQGASTGVKLSLTFKSLI